MLNQNDIAIIGISCRVPDANNYRELWKNLLDGKESVRKFSEEELKKFGVPDEKREHPRYIPHGATAENTDCFDATFFGYSPKEATKIDPQQRFFLECCWEALEDAGYANPQINQNVGVFAGFGSLLSSYAFTYHTAHPEIEGTTIGSELFSLDRDYGATRVSYKLNLTGPAINVQCACSTSLVATHLACRSILDGDSKMALAGGASICALNYIGYIQESGGPESEDGHIRTFSANSNGTVFGRGAGVVLLKKLSEALKDGDHIYAVIKSTAINNDGSFKKSYASPSEEGQAACMVEALEKANINPETISYAIAHGTATLVGDPIEAESLTKAFRKWTDKKQFCALGAIKPNLSHLDSAAGVMNLIVSALALYHKKILPLINFTEPNPKIDFKNSPFYITTQAKDWENENHPRRILTTAFGVGGTNACAILEEAPASSILNTNNADSPAYIFPFSAKNREALTRQIEQFKKFVKDGSYSLKDLSYTLGTARHHFLERIAIVASSKQDLIEKLDELIIPEKIPNLVPPKIAFIFSGQGAQYRGMTKELYHSHPLFKEWIDKAEKELKPILDHSLTSLLFDVEDAVLSETKYLQPVLFAVEFALFKLFESLGIIPNYVLGHSLGEYVAAVVSGALTFEDGLKLVSKRGEIISSLPHNEGAMAAILATKEDVEAQIKAFKGRLNIAGYNGIHQTVIAGKKNDVETFIQHFKAKGIQVHILPISHAFHSYLLEPIVPIFEQTLKKYTFSDLNIPLISNLTGEKIEGKCLSPEYFVKHLLSPVRFVDDIKTLETEGCTVFVEIGPQPILLNSVKSSINESTHAEFIPTLQKNKNDWIQLLEALASLYTLNINLNWNHLFQHFSAKKLPLPTYPFEKKSYWVESSHESGFFSKSGNQSKLSPLLSSKVNTPVGIEIYQHPIDLKENSQSYLLDHVILDHILFPAAGFLEVLAEIAKDVTSSSHFKLENISINAPLQLHPENSVLMQNIVESNDLKKEVTIFTEKSADWIKHVTGSIEETEKSEKIFIDLPNKLNNEKTDFKKEDFYQSLKKEGANYGPNFQGVNHFFIENSVGWAFINTPTNENEELIHPTLFDAALQISNYFANSLNDNWNKKKNIVALPTKIDSFQFYQPVPSKAVVQIHKITFPDDKSLKADFNLLSLTGELCAKVQGATLTHTNKTNLSKNLYGKDSLPSFYYKEDWEEKSAEQEIATETATYLIISSDQQDTLSKSIRDELLKQNHHVVSVSEGPTFKKLNADFVTMPLTEPQSYAKLLEEFLNIPHLKIISLLHFDPSPSTELNIKTLRKGMDFLKSIYYLLQQILLKTIKNPPSLYCICHGLWSQTPGSSCAVAPLVGFRRGFAQENPDINFTLLDVDFSNSIHQGLPLLINEFLTHSDEKEISYRSGKRFVNRIVRYKDWVQKHHILALPDANHYRLIKTENLSSLDHLVFKEYEPKPLLEDEVELSVYAVGLNFRDLLNAMNLYPGDAGLLGTDCVGKITKIGTQVQNCKPGDLVLGFAHGCLGNYTTTKSSLVHPIPLSLKIPDAAAIPTIFLTSYHALVQLAKLKKGERVLIHAAAGGVGLSAIQIAQEIGAEVYATCSSDVKKQVLEKLNVKHIYNSRSLAFGKEILKDTQNQGVDVVLNSLSGEGFIETSLSCLRDGGRFLEIGKRNIWTEEQMKKAKKDIQYFIIALDTMTSKNPLEIQTLLKEVLEYFDKGIYQPIPHISFPLNQTKEALRYLQDGKQIGKVIVEIPRTGAKNIQPDKSYLIIGGLGGIGLTMAEWLIEKGANHLILVGRKSPSKEVSIQLDEWRKKGVQVLVQSCDVSNADSVDALFDKIVSTSMPSLVGIFHSAGLSHVNLLLNTQWKNIEDMCDSKIWGSFYLNNALNKHKLNLDFFVHFSSNSSVTGAPGQMGYCAANAFIDSFARFQFQQGTPTTSLNWSLWKEVGMGTPYEQANLNVGFKLFSPRDSFPIMEYCLSHQCLNLAVMDLDWNIYIPKSNDQDTRMKHLKEVSQSVKKEQKGQRLTHLLEKNSQSEWPKIIAIHLQELMKTVLGTKESLDVKTPFNQLGLDSLARNEFIAKLEKSIDHKKRFNYALLNTYPTIESFAEFLSSDLEKICSTHTQPQSKN